MSSNVPVVKQINWISLIPHIVVMSVLILGWQRFFPYEGGFLGIVSYFLISFLLRTQIPKLHRKGIKLVKNEGFEKAIPYFEKSHEFFKRNNWIDKYRFITLLSSSRMTYKEMALANIAFCYGQLGDGEKSKECYLRTLEEYPDNGLAKAGLRMLNSTMAKEQE